jgi:hypothetical protein
MSFGNFSRCSTFPLKFPRPFQLWDFQMTTSLPQQLAAICDTRLALIDKTASNFKAQLLDLTKLRDQVRKAEQSALKYEARKSEGSLATRTKPRHPRFSEERTQLAV